MAGKKRSLVEDLVWIRDTAKKNKDYKTADMIREYIEHYYELKLTDTEWGYIITRSR